MIESIDKAKSNIIINNYVFIPCEKIKQFKCLEDLLNIFHFPLNCSTNSLNIDFSRQKIENLDIKKDKIINGQDIKKESFEIKTQNNNKNETKEEKEQQLTKTQDVTSGIYKEKKTNIHSKIKLFNTNIKNKKGRKPKHSMVYSYHNKFSQDNILRKVKGKFLHKITNYINSIILSKYRDQIDILKPLAGKISQNNSINFNKILLKTKLKDIYSTYGINGKFRAIEKNHNKNVVNTIYNKNIKELIDILEMNFLEVFCIFRDLNETQKLNGLEKIDSVIREIKIKYDNEEYIHKLYKTMINFENFYLNKKERK